MKETPLCRLNGAPLSAKPALTLDNAPRGVQFFPSAEELASDQGVEFSVWTDASGMVQAPSAQVVYTDGITAMTAGSPDLMAHRKEQILDFIRRYSLKGKKVLDVGCGDGHLLDIFEAEGVSAYGIDPSEKSARIAQGKGRKVVHGFMGADYRHPDGPFDAFVSFHVLEHIPDLADFIRGVRNNLKDDGAGLIEVPSLEQLLELKRFYDFFPDHLNYFSLRTLRLAMELNGFDVDETIRAWKGEHNVALVRSYSGVSLEAVKTSLNSLVSSFTKLVESETVAGRRVALWGASCHALVMLGECGPVKLEYIVDGATYKQGRFAPASHYRIVAPSELRRDPVDTLIVMAPRYETEILNDISKLGFDGKLLVVRGDAIEPVLEPAGA